MFVELLEKKSETVVRVGKLLTTGQLAGTISKRNSPFLFRPVEFVSVCGGWGGGVGGDSVTLYTARLDWHVV
jgi:hypothetical protein